MRQLKITLDDVSFAELDTVSRTTGLTPAEFANRVVVAAVQFQKGLDAARRDEEGYAAAPVTPEEFAVDSEDLKWNDLNSSLRSSRLRGKKNLNREGAKNAKEEKAIKARSASR